MVGLVYVCLALALSSDSFLQVNAETTVVPGNHTHHHKEPNEIENFSFFYDGSSHMLLVLADTKCYIWSLTSQQQQNVHTDDGLRAIELKVLGDIDRALYTVVPKSILATTIQRNCGKSTASFFLVH